ncbi:MAG: adenosylcobalamin-dependent ribonucleoside-diphosphate reductase [Candidatus Caldarchaeum sp.]|nr:adenosylcobalamin-dependent ribonucleoside-diphosphate reductase [Candidatus Caldarchaeum sp.]MDW8435242.1 adenosylcobalamin-dependent ribonucleoside-diphosphate reductase [Candidatus Caldarchaeum sp.]
MGLRNLPLKVVKRDGRVVDFDAGRIREAVRKAMASRGLMDEAVLESVVASVLDKLAERYGTEKIPHVEEIQDIVEAVLMDHGLKEVAKAYILYRHERTRIREEKMRILEATYVDEVDKKFSVNAIRLMAARYLLKDKTGKIAEKPKQMFQRTAALIVLADVVYDPMFFDLSGNHDRKPVEDDLIAGYAGKIGVGPSKQEIETTWNVHHLERLAALYRRLDEKGQMKKTLKEILEFLRENPDAFYRQYRKYYQIMVEKRFLPNSPTLFNAGTVLGQLSACFVLDVEDDITSIMRTAEEAAIIFKTGGGVGINYSKLRPEGDVVASTGGVASGPVSFMRIIDVVTDVVKQGGRRRGANIGVLDISHPDVEKFITAKQTPGFLENFNISVMVKKDFWQHYEDGKPYPLVNPRDGSVWKTGDPRTLLHLIAENAWRTADPGLLYHDNINRLNPLRQIYGEINCVNPCGEQPLYPHESCNLGSINLHAFVKDGVIDWEELGEAVETAVMFLDNVVDLTKHPTKAIETMTLRTRRIGLGIMGLADMLYELGIPYNSEQGFETMAKIMEYIAYKAVETSVKIAQKRGPFPDFNGSSWADGIIPFQGLHDGGEPSMDWEKLREMVKKGIRNSHLLTVAPTGSISMLADVSSGLEPQFAIVYRKQTTAGTYYYVDQVFEKYITRTGLPKDDVLKKVAENGGSVQEVEEIPPAIRRVFVTALDIPWWDHLRAQHEVQKWVDASVSKTINMPSWVAVEDVFKVFIAAHKLGLKGVTVYRDGSKTAQVLSTPTQRSGKYVVEIVNKTPEMLRRFGIDVRPIPARALVSSAALATVCPVCVNQNIVFQEGCQKCLDCGWSSCVTA